jgi:hypothetical protein
MTFWAFVGTVGFIFAPSGVNTSYCLQRSGLIGKPYLIVAHLSVPFTGGE